MDVEIVAGSDPPTVRVRPPSTQTAAQAGAVQQLAENLVALGYPEWIRDCARVHPDPAHGPYAWIFELACKHEGTVSAVRKADAHGAYVECTRCACRIGDDEEVWLSPPRHGWR
jgi:hypothetical protein